MRRSLAWLGGLCLLVVGCQPDAIGPTAPIATDLITAAQETSEPGTVASSSIFDVSATIARTDFALGQPDDLPPVTAKSSHLAGGINPVVTETGLISLSVDALGVYPGSSGSLQVDKPAGATVRGAYLASATVWTCCSAIPDGGITLNGQPVAWQLATNPVAPWSQWADVTPLVKGTLDAAAPGIVNIPLSEPFGTGNVDGSILAVIFDDPNQTTDNTVSLLFGGQQLSGDDFFIGLSDPVDTSDPSLTMHMSLGISYGYQRFGGGQRSIVDVNGARLTSSAGGEDDGAPANGGLITAGGVGDSPANPPPFATPSNPRTDDELYNLVPFVNDGDQIIAVHTSNPSNDDNIFFAAFFLTVAAEVVTEDPVANAGPDQTIESPNTFDLDGSASFDPDGTIVSYDWYLGATHLASGANPTGLSLPVGTHTITLVVVDNDGLTDDDEVIITVEPPADDTPPVITYVLSGDTGDNGWYVGPVSVVWTVVDDESDIISTTGCDPATEPADGTGYSWTCSATSGGGSASVTTVEFMIDQTDPTVTWAGNALTYDIADDVDITCTVADNLSGVASDDCADIDQPAWSLGLGTHTFEATATDNAGNSFSASTTFSVGVSFDGVCALVEAWVDHHGVANSLCVKLAAAQRADARGNTSARDGSLSAFINEVNAQSGKKVPADKAPYLVAFAEALMGL